VARRRDAFRSTHPEDGESSSSADDERTLISTGTSVSRVAATTSRTAILACHAWSRPCLS
jgi:hypothetical protein